MRRLTMRLTPSQYEILDLMAETMSKTPALIAREIVQQALDGMQFILEKEGGQAVTSEVVLKRLFRVSLSQMQIVLDEFDNTLSK